jgi:hypothetical protein
MNEIEFENEIMEELEENSSWQIESNTILNIDEKITKLILETLCAQKKKQRPHNGNALCWFFSYVTNNKEITNKVFQIIHCMYLMSYQTNDHRKFKNKIKEGSNIIF